MLSTSKPTVVIDTNLFISAIILKKNNIPNKLINAWRENNYQLVLSEELIDEVENVLKREKICKKYKISIEEINVLVLELRNAAVLAKSLRLDKLPVHSRDSKDDNLLACALGGGCDYLITGDEDLLVLNGKKELGKLQIIKAAEFLQKKRGRK